MTEQNQDISQQLMQNNINDDKFWELKPQTEDETQIQEQQQEQILDQVQINEGNPKNLQGFWGLCIFQCIGDCLASFCIEVIVRGLC
ncbi:unnamed protein product [Paramecium primaurelia]|uniref:Uncharacterized protein n=1 Tax=Paramecium primaurelia TaxID=5886 RepID=A0A8S1QGE1_PARPR|nr:unnamed protein product [Paramecium primaurelia]